MVRRTARRSSRNGWTNAPTDPTCRVNWRTSPGQTGAGTLGILEGCGREVAAGSRPGERERRGSTGPGSAKGRSALESSSHARRGTRRRALRPSQEVPAFGASLRRRPRPQVNADGHASDARRADGPRLAGHANGDSFASYAGPHHPLRPIRLVHGLRLASQPRYSTTTARGRPRRGG